MNTYLLAATTFFVMSFGSVQASSFLFTKDLGLGDEGKEVTELQNQLIQMGYSIPSLQSHAKMKGTFGVETQAAITEYQKALGISETGNLDEDTRGYLNEGVMSLPHNATTTLDQNSNISDQDSNASTTQAATTTQSVDTEDEPEITLTSPQNIDFLQEGKLQTISWNVDDKGTFASTSVPTVDIRLITSSANPYLSSTSCAVSCDKPADSSPLIATGIDARQGSYSWQVGNILMFGTTNAGMKPVAVPGGLYMIQICISGKNICDTTASPITLYSTLGTQSPVITSVEGPTSLPVNTSATWTIHAYDPQNQSLSFLVNWDDGTETAFSPSDTVQGTLYAQGIEISHTYTKERTYNPTFTAINKSGLSTVNSMDVYTSYRSSAFTLSIN